MQVMVGIFILFTQEVLFLNHGYKARAEFIASKDDMF
jgi:hypothetical protein